MEKLAALALTLLLTDWLITQWLQHVSLRNQAQTRQWTISKRNFRNIHGDSIALSYLAWWLFDYRGFPDNENNRRCLAAWFVELDKTL